MSETGLYVYGLVPRGALERAPDLPGVDSARPVELRCEGGICAIVSRVDLDRFDEEPLRERLADMDWVERTARRHQEVLDAVLAACTPIPMRLCTVYQDDAGLRRMLDEHQEGLLAALTELSGTLEWGVQAFHVPETPAAPPRPGGQPGETASGTAYLQTRLRQRHAAEHAEAEIARACEELHDALSGLALAARLGAPQRPEASGRDTPMVLNAVYLVANADRARFTQRTAQLGSALAPRGVALRLTGPWAPYSFVPAAVGGAR